MNQAIGAIVGLILLVVLLGAILAWPVMTLWNGCLIGAVDGVHPIGFMQAWGIMVLCGLLFKPTTSSN